MTERRAQREDIGRNAAAHRACHAVRAPHAGKPGGPTRAGKHRGCVPRGCERP
jgi:hypothetical protein